MSKNPDVNRVKCDDLTSLIEQMHKRISVIENRAYSMNAECILGADASYELVGRGDARIPTTVELFDNEKQLLINKFINFFRVLCIFSDEICFEIHRNGNIVTFQLAYRDDREYQNGVLYLDFSAQLISQVKCYLIYTNLKGQEINEVIDMRYKDYLVDKLLNLMFIWPTWQELKREYNLQQLPP